MRYRQSFCSFDMDLISFVCRLVSILLTPKKMPRNIKQRDTHYTYSSFIISSDFLNPILVVSLLSFAPVYTKCPPGDVDGWSCPERC
jgi:hypothetical protein